METAHKFLKRRKLPPARNTITHARQGNPRHTAPLRNLKAGKMFSSRDRARKGIPAFPDFSLQTILCPLAVLHSSAVAHRQTPTCWVICPVNPPCGAHCSLCWGKLQRVTAGLCCTHLLKKASLARCPALHWGSKLQGTPL